MSDPGAAIQKAIFTVLDGNITITKAGSPFTVPVYDYVPQDSAYPYVVIDGTEIINDDPLASRRDERMIYLSVWSQYLGQKETWDILAAIDNLLHNTKPVPDVGRIAICRVNSKRTVREPDNLTFQGQAKIHVLTEF